MIEDFFNTIFGYIIFHPFLPFADRFTNYINGVPYDYQTLVFLIFFTIYFGIYGFICLKIMTYLNEQFPDININSKRNFKNILILILRYYFTVCVAYLGIAGLLLFALFILMFAMVYSILFN